MSANCMLFSDLSEVELMTSPIPYHTQYPFPITLGTFRLVSYIRSSTPLLHPQPHGFADFVCFSWDDNQTHVHSYCLEGDKAWSSLEWEWNVTVLSLRQGSKICIFLSWIDSGLHQVVQTPPLKNPVEYCTHPPHPLPFHPFPPHPLPFHPFAPHPFNELLCGHAYSSMRNR